MELFYLFHCDLGKVAEGEQCLPLSWGRQPWRPKPNLLSLGSPGYHCCPVILDCWTFLNTSMFRSLALPMRVVDKENVKWCQPHSLANLHFSDWKWVKCFTSPDRDSNSFIICVCKCFPLPQYPAEVCNLLTCQKKKLFPPANNSNTPTTLKLPPILPPIILTRC